MNAPSPIERAQAKLAQMRADGIEVQRLTPTEKALADPASRPKAIRATCYECLGAEDCPNIRDEIAFCTAWGCALWHLRPHQQLCATPERWPHKHLVRANYGEPFGVAKRQAALAKAAARGAIEDRLHGSAARDPGSNKAAIRARCLQCTGGVKADITHCKAEFGQGTEGKYCGCPLWQVRPYQPDQKEHGTDTETEPEESGDPESMQ